MLRTLVLNTILILALLNAGASECAAAYNAFEWDSDGSCQDLGTLPGGADSWAYASNDSGQVAGWSTDSTGQREAVLWEPDGSMVDLGPGTAYDINDLGQVAGTSNGLAVLWDADGTMHDIGSGVALGLNNDGQVVGSLNDAPGSGGSKPEAFLWSASDGVTYLGQPGTLGTSAYSINDNGWVCGSVSVNNDESEAFIWDAKDGWTILGDGSALDINNAGQVVGNSSLNQAFLWSADTGQIGLSGFVAYGMNSSGQVAGYSWGSDNNMRATVWLNGSLAPYLGLPAGYIWSKACDINDQGQVVGAAMSIPEPSSAAALVLGFCGLVSRRVR